LVPENILPFIRRLHLEEFYIYNKKSKKLAHLKLKPHVGTGKYSSVY
jgi:hypothetical protein